MADETQLELLDLHEDQACEVRRTAFPCIVVNYNLNNGSPWVDIQPANKYEIASTGEVVTPAIIQQVPVALPRTGASIDLYPIQKGDIGHCVVMDRCLDDFMDGNGGPIIPTDDRMKDPNDAQFHLGGWPFSVEHSSNLPNNARAVIVDSSKSGVYIGDPDVELEELEGTLDLVLFIDFMNTVLTALDASALGGANAAKLGEITTMLQKIKVTI
jgi:hypothetical protein